MWIFARTGFYSVVASSQQLGQMTVRARDRRHLEELCKLCDLWEGEIVETPKADYRWRISVPRAVWLHIAAKLAKEVVYPNFKSAAGKNERAVGGAYVDALHDIWDRMYRMQTAAALPQKAPKARARAKP